MALLLFFTPLFSLSFSLSLSLSRASVWYRVALSCDLPPHRRITFGHTHAGGLEGVPTATQQGQPKQKNYGGESQMCAFSLVSSAYTASCAVRTGGGAMKQTKPSSVLLAMASDRQLAPSPKGRKPQNDQEGS